jgi:hypothetical protein
MGTMRWGQNTVARVEDLGTGLGQHLYAQFTGTGGVNECHLALGDSGGPVFINDGSGYKLAGIAHVVDGPFNTTNTGDGFQAALFDVRGLYAGNGSGGWTYITGVSPVPSGFHATRVSVRAEWINSVLFPPDDEPLLSGSQGTLLLILFAGLGAGLLPKTVNRVR